MKIERLLVFGDIHGKWDKFLSAYEKVHFDPEKDMLIFLGDYLDRGENPVPVMDWVLEHQGRENILFLRGNHEDMFYWALKPYREGLEDWDDVGLTHELMLWLPNGGKATLKKIIASDRGRELVPAWLRLIEKLPLYTEIKTQGRTYWFMHADCDPERPLEEQQEETLLWTRHLATSPEAQRSDRTIVLGHTPVQSIGYEPVPQILQGGRLVLMDTGSFLPGGRISCLDLLSGTVCQSD